jgi:hypothetical protein
MGTTGPSVRFASPAGWFNLGAMCNLYYADLLIIPTVPENGLWRR